MLFAKKCACSRTSIDDSKEENKKFDRTVIQSLEVLQRSVNNLKVEQELCLSCSCQHCRDSSIVFPEFLVGSVLFIFLVFCVLFWGGAGGLLVYYLRPVSCVPNVASVCGLSILSVITKVYLLKRVRVFKKSLKIPKG